MTVDAQLLRDDENARTDALDVSRSFIVQAPAGSGKTELLIQRYLKLLAIVDHPEEVLAITFTRKAAAEMRLRVLQALQRAEKNLKPQQPHEQLTHKAAIAALQRDRKLQWHLIEYPRRMRIQTLDSLNASIARSRPLTSAGGGTASTIVANSEMQSLYNEAATLTFDQLLESGPLHAATEQVLSHLDNNTGLYVEYLAKMLATRDQWLPFIGSGLVESDQETRLRQRFEASLAAAVVEQLERTRRAVPDALLESIFELGATAATTLSEAGNEEHPVCALLGRNGIPVAAPDAVSQWRALTELLLTGQGAWRKTVNKANGFPAGAIRRDEMIELLHSLTSAEEFRRSLNLIRDLPPTRYSDEQWSVLLALFLLLPLAVTELKRLFASRTVSDYVEVALNATLALGTADDPGAVALLLDYQLRHLLVDEMQDTSTAQYQMIEALTGGWQEGDGRTLFCVGDPMQSIYRFRNAEVGQFLLARRSGIGSVKLESLTLRQNFRSGENLVNWFNSVFPSVLPADDDLRQSAVAYAPAVAVPAYEGQGACTIYPLFGSGVNAEAETGIGIIRRTLEQDADGDMVVLVRSRTQLPQLLSRLRAAEIPYRAVDIDRLTDLPEITDILALTRAIVHRGDRIAWLALLRAPWVGLDWTDLHELVRGDNKATIWELIHDDKRLAGLSQYGRDAVSKFRQRLQEDQQNPGMSSLHDRVERLWLALGGPAILDDRHAVENIYRFLDVIESLAVAGTLPDVAQLENALDAERVSSDADTRLQIMTMHRAKGLQFDHVLLYGLGRTPGRTNRAVLGWYDFPGQQGNAEKVISPVGPRAFIDNDPVHRFIEKIEANKNHHELGRLLYVACTRARQTLHLLGHVEVAADGETFRPARANSLLNFLWPAVHDDFDRAFVAGMAADANLTGRDPWVTPELRRFSAPWQVPDAATIPGGEPSHPGVADAHKVDFHWVGSSARVAGTVVHRWLQIAAEGQVDLDRITPDQLRLTSERWLGDLGFVGDSSKAIIDRVQTAVHRMMHDDKGRWLLDGNGHAELALTGLFDDQVVSVILDRIRIDADGTHWVVDYKTGSHEGGQLNTFLRSEVERYSPQLQKYAFLYRNFSGANVRCALYYPLLGEFVEVRVPQDSG